MTNLADSEKLAIAKRLFVEAMTRQESYDLRQAESYKPGKRRDNEVSHRQKVLADAQAEHAAYFDAAMSGGPTALPRNYGF